MIMEHACIHACNDVIPVKTHTNQYKGYECMKK